MKIDSSIALTIARQLRELTSSYAKTVAHISTGKRVLSPRDGPADFSTISSLKTKINRLSRGIQNVNQEQGLVTTATAALSSQLDLLNRMKEIAVEGRSAILSSSARLALDKELQELMSEYRRITRDTEFNGRQLLNGDQTWSLNTGDSNFSVDTIGTRSSDVFKKLVGTGAFTRTQTGVGGGVFVGNGSSVGDVNGDGIPDFVTNDRASNTMSVNIGIGNGKFKARVTFATVAGTAPKIADFNGDGRADIVQVDENAGSISVFIGRGDGTFNGRVTYASPNSAHVGAAFGDVDNDGDLDIIGDNVGPSVYLNNGLGAFGPRQTIDASINGAGFAFGDLNGDGNGDIVSGTFTDGHSRIYYGRGNGTFESAVIIGAGLSLQYFKLGDFDNDGDQDIIAGVNQSLRVLRNDGENIFTSTQTMTLGTGAFGSDFGDINRDGKLDYFTSDSNGVAYVYLGNGNATFTLNRTFSGVGYASLADLNRDGILDTVGEISSGQTWAAWLGLGQEENRESEVSVSSTYLAGSAIEVIDNAINKVLKAQNSWANVSKRLEIAQSYNERMLETSSSALSQIEDADLAEETAKLVSIQIRQQITTAMLAQAHSQWQVVLNLIYGGSR